MEQLPLFNAYPKLKDHVPWVHLGDLPTSVQKLEKLGNETGLDALYIKRGDQSSTYYGGNKVRKLEFLLAEAKQKGAEILITIGAVGSNHALATTIHGQRLGMHSILILVDQPVAHYARRNMLLDYRYGAEMIKASKPFLPFHIAYQRLRHAGRAYFIPLGGTCSLSCLGYVNAAFELRKQVEDGLLPEPDYLFVALGSMGTGAGLHLGCKLAGLKTEVVGVRVYDKSACNPRQMASLINRTCAYLRRFAPEVTCVEISPREVTILDDYFGQEYARFTEEGMEAVSLMRALEGIELDGTYTGKTLAGTLDYALSHLRDKVILFWNTYNSVDLSPEIEGLDYHRLPKAFHKYFELPLQEFDRR